MAQQNAKTITLKPEFTVGILPNHLVVINPLTGLAIICTSIVQACGVSLSHSKSSNNPLVSFDEAPNANQLIMLVVYFGCGDG